MSMPPGIATVTLTGRYVYPDGTPLVGTVTFATPALLTLSGADTISAGAVTVTLDPSGQFSVILIATDNVNSQPTGWLYQVTERFKDVSARTYSIPLPQGTPTVNLADIAPANPATGNYFPVVGPAGADGADGIDGRTILSGSGAPSSGIGVAGDFYMDTTAWAIYGPKTTTWPSAHPLSGTPLISSVNGLTGAVNLTAASVGAEPAGAAATAQTAATNAAKTYTDSAITSEVTRANSAYATGSQLASATDRITANEAAISARKRLTIRRGGIADLALADPLYSGTAPTITPAQTTTSSITNAVKYAPPLVALSGSDVRGDFLFLGGTDFQIGATSPDTSYALPTSRYPHTYASGQGSWAFEFVTDASVFEMRFKYISSASVYKMSVDGKPLTATPVSIGGTTTGSGHMLKVDFGSSAVRRVRFDLYTVPFGGIYIGPSASLWRPVTARGRLMVLGDSITDGSTQNAGGGTGTWLYKAARMMGITDVWDQARGGTGYITPGSYAIFGDRLTADVVAYSPDVLIIKGGYNDNTGSQSAVQSAAAALFSAAKTALPSTQIIVAGPIAPTATPATSLTNTDTTLRTEAATAGLPYISLVTGETRNGAGAVISTQSPFITAANAATMIGADGIHPTDAGHAELGRWMVRALAPVLPL